MIQMQGTGTPPVEDTAEQPPGRRHGTYQHGLVVVAAPGQNRHYAPDQAESEVAS